MRPKAGTIHQMSAAAAADMALVYGPRLGSEKTGISPTRRPLLLLHSSMAKRISAAKGGSR